jgi:hypothetical protein
LNIGNGGAKLDHTSRILCLRRTSGTLNHVLVAREGVAGIIEGDRVRVGSWIRHLGFR